MRPLAHGWAAATAIAGALVACGASRLPAPTYVEQPTEALSPVDYPPPPARVEFVPPTPNDTAVWIDGEWIWQGRRWAWKPGRWLRVPANASFSPWTAVRDETGVLYVAEGKWRDKQGHELPDPAPLAVGRTRGGAVISPGGEEVSPAPNVPPVSPPTTSSDAGVEDGG
jgi:hypothetical protein